MENISIAMRTFNEKVRTANQTNGRTITLTIDEARSLHADIFSLLANISELSSSKVVPVVEATFMDGGSFR